MQHAGAGRNNMMHADALVPRAHNDHWGQLAQTKTTMLHSQPSHVAMLRSKPV